QPQPGNTNFRTTLYNALLIFTSSRAQLPSRRLYRNNIRVGGVPSPTELLTDINHIAETDSSDRFGDD
ncbi:MAG TPA: hypothetical protein VMX97_14680, partial [Hyphomicrobiaceae bacterium]|nr:hypothetical protein [Hyphomicrobiaceae bacterium]